jgi:hypothetical protein
MEEKKTVSVQRRPALSGTGEQQDNGYRVSRPQHRDRCHHKLLSVVPVVSMRVDGGYVGRCLLCGMTGPLRGNGEDARRVVLLEHTMRDEE